MGRRRDVTVCVSIAAPAARVWRALCDPDEVQQWDGARPVAVPPDYPRPGQHARWKIVAAGPVTLTLHDHVREVVAPRRLAAQLRIGPVVIDETYTLEETSDGDTALTSANTVHARVPGLRGWAARRVRRSVAAALARLQEWCERPPA